MLKNLLLAVALLGFLLTVHDAQAQGYGGGRYYGSVTRCPRNLPVLQFQQCVNADLLGIYPNYGYNFGRGYGDNHYNRNRGGTGELLKDALLAGGGYVVGRWDEKRRQNKREKEAGRQSEERRQESTERREPVYETRREEPIQQDDYAEFTLRVVNSSGADVQLIVTYGDKLNRYLVQAGQSVNIARNYDRIKATIKTRQGELEAEVSLDREQDRTLIVIAPEVG